MADSGEEKKIFVDEDWKAKVEAEREAMKKPAEERKRPPEELKEPREEQRVADEPPLPPASLASLITSLAMEAMAAMGIVSDSAGKAEVRLGLARYLIDTLQVLEEKTASHRTEAESQLLESTLHQLRMGFVAMQSRATQP